VKKQRHIIIWSDARALFAISLVDGIFVFRAKKIRIIRWNSYCEKPDSFYEW